MRFDTYCNNKAHRLNIMGVTIVISYETPIAAAYDGVYKRLHNSWGPTTGKHMNELGVRNWPEVEYAEFEEFINVSLAKAALDLVGNKLGGDHV